MGELLSINMFLIRCLVPQGRPEQAQTLDCKRVVLDCPHTAYGHPLISAPARMPQASAEGVSGCLQALAICLGTNDFQLRPISRGHRKYGN